MTEINHHHVFRGLRLCGSKTGSALPMNPITCPHCREILLAKAEKHETQANRSRGHEARFFAADAARTRQIVNGATA